MHLVGFAIKIYYDARPYERQKRRMYFLLSRNEFLNIIHRSSNLPTGTYGSLMELCSLSISLLSFLQQAGAFTFSC